MRVNADRVQKALKVDKTKFESYRLPPRCVIAMTRLSSGALLNAQQPTEALRCPDHLLVRNSLRTCTLASGHSLLWAARLRHNAAKINATHGRSHRRGTDALAATAQQSSAVMTPLLQLQKRLQDSGAVLDALDLSYKQTVASRKVRQGEVAAMLLLTCTTHTVAVKVCKTVTSAGAYEHPWRCCCHKGGRCS